MTEQKIRQIIREELGRAAAVWKISGQLLSWSNSDNSTSTYQPSINETIDLFVYNMTEAE